jgi:hypothetical protein
MNDFNLNEELRKAVLDATRYERQAPEAAPPKYDFEMLGSRIADSMVQAAEEQVATATENLERTKQLADKLRLQIDEKYRELASMNERLRVFGTTVLDAHATFNGAHDEADTEETQD